MTSTTALPAYLLPETAVVGPTGALMVGGMSLLELADEFGTPAFIYDEAHLESKCRDAVAAFPDGAAYASKAFTCLAMARIAINAGMHLDVATAGEMYVALRAGADPKKLVMHGNNKSEFEIELALRVGIGKIVIDSFDEIARIERVFTDAASRTAKHFAQQYGLEDLDLDDLPDNVDCMIRLNAGIDAHTHEFIQTGQTDSKFGISLDGGHAQQAADLIKSSKRLNLIGAHGHVGSMIFESEPFAKEVERIAPFVLQNELKELCVGGGLGVPYVVGEYAPSFSDWARGVHGAVSASDLPSDVRITAEPGRSISAAAAITIYRVGTKKYIEGIRTYVAVDGGMSDNPRPILYGSGYEAFLPRAPFVERGLTVTVVGKHCESGDFVVVDGKVPDDIKVGDILATPVSGAYGHSMASNYNCVPRPPVIFVKGGRARVVVRRETLRDLVGRDA